MPNESTPAQLAALAKELGITPETHRQFVWDTSSGENVNVTGYPCPFSGTPASDDVWQAPLMRYLKSRFDWTTEGLMIYLADTADEWGAVLHDYQSVHVGNECAPTITAALLHAARAARVPEIMAIFGEGE